MRLLSIWVIGALTGSVVWGQDQQNNNWWSQDVTVGPGVVTSKGQTITVQSPVNKKVRVNNYLVPHITLAPKTAVVDTEFIVTRGSIFAKETYFKDVNFELHLSCSQAVEDSIFVDCYRKKGGGWFARLSPQWEAKNSIFVRDEYAQLTVTEVGMKWENCTFYDTEFKGSKYKKDIVEESTHEWRTIKNCKFVNCKIPETLLISTENCYFVGCSFERWDSELALKQTVTTEFKVDRINSNVPKGRKDMVYKVTELAESEATAGSTIPHEYKSGKLTVAGYPEPETASAKTIGGNAVTIPKPNAKDTDPPEPTTTKTPKPSGGNSIFSEEGMIKPVVSANASAKAIQMATNKTKIKGLLVLPLGGARYAGKASQMNLIVLPADQNSPSTLTFNQPVGSTMASALEEVSKFIQIEHGGWPRGGAMEISFENKYTGKDGPSAALACALLIDSAITGKVIDDFFAVTGDLNVDGSVRPIGGVAAKIRGATSKDCTVVAIPADNANLAEDIVILSGVKSVADIQVFTVKDFEQTALIAYREEDGDIAKAISLFGDVQRVIAQSPNNTSRLLRNPKVRERLSEVLKLAPNHYSASLLLDSGAGQTPEILSLAGSLDAIEYWASTIIGALDLKQDEYSALDGDELNIALGRLRSIRKKLAPKTHQYSDSVTVFGEHLAELQKQQPSGSRLQQLIEDILSSGEKAGRELETLKRDPEVMEQLIQ